LVYFQELNQNVSPGKIHFIFSCAKKSWVLAKHYKNKANLNYVMNYFEIGKYKTFLINKK
jgi:hypothetical protein